MCSRYYGTQFTVKYRNQEIFFNGQDLDISSFPQFMRILLQTLIDLDDPHDYNRYITQASQEIGHSFACMKDYLGKFYKLRFLIVTLLHYLHILKNRDIKHNSDNSLYRCYPFNIPVAIRLPGKNGKPKKVVLSAEERKRLESYYSEAIYPLAVFHAPAFELWSAGKYGGHIAPNVTPSDDSVLEYTLFLVTMSFISIFSNYGSQFDYHCREFLKTMCGRATQLPDVAKFLLVLHNLICTLCETNMRFADVDYELTETLSPFWRSVAIWLGASDSSPFSCVKVGSRKRSWTMRKHMFFISEMVKMLDISDAKARVSFLSNYAYVRPNSLYGRVIKYYKTNPPCPEEAALLLFSAIVPPHYNTIQDDKDLCTLLIDCAEQYRGILLSFIKQQDYSTFIDNSFLYKYLIRYDGNVNDFVQYLHEIILRNN